jgi:hypothetical protein
VNGFWVVAETLQGGGMPDHVYGPYWSHDEAATVASDFRTAAETVGRWDSYQVGCIEVEEA